jgi:hypothetical protein
MGENGPRAKCDQVVFEAIAKAAEIVVGSRCWIDPNMPISVGGGETSSSRRFNLLVPEVQGVRYVLFNESSHGRFAHICSRTSEDRE